MRRSLPTLCAVAGLWFSLILLTFVLVAPAMASPPAPDDEPFSPKTFDPTGDSPSNMGKLIDQPNPLDYQRLQRRQRLLDAGQWVEASALDVGGSDRVLVILVEFAGTDVFTWTQGLSDWDPLGRADTNEALYDANGNVSVGNCSRITNQTQAYTYSGPLHNQIPRPLSASDRSGSSIWTPDFSREWFQNLLFGNGVTFHYTRTDGSLVHEDFTGKSVRQYYLDMSGGEYALAGDMVGWVQVPHSTWWYGADKCPGARSYTGGSASPANSGGIPGAGDSRSLVRDALDAVNAISNTISGFNWANYDRNGDGVIDRLWIVHAGYGEEDSTTLLNRTSYGEGALWSHSASVAPPYPVAPGTAAGPYIMMPENGGIAVFAHEYGHNLGAGDLYAYGDGQPSAGFWTIMADDWTGYPTGFQPPAFDPLHLDLWGWLDPYVITDPTRIYTVTLGQASNFPGGAGVYRGIRLGLERGSAPLAVQPIGQYQWWGGKQKLTNATMTSKNPFAIPAAGATLVFSTAYNLEDKWDFLWVQASLDGQQWTTLTNAQSTCQHDAQWIGGQYGFPTDLCAAGIGGFTGRSASFPEYQNESFDLAAFAGRSIYVRFWYMTDWGAEYDGPFVDSIKILETNGTTLFADGAEAGDANWNYRDGWVRIGGSRTFNHNYYLQWRNVGSSGGYDSALGDSRWSYGPANTGLLVWYNNSLYTDNEIYNYVADPSGFGPKGRMLVVDAHADPYRDPSLAARGFDNEAGNLAHRSLMRDAPFSLNRTVDFSMTTAFSGTQPFSGRPAVGQFDDGQGYYPGAEYVLRGSGYSPPSSKWVTKQWDASAVLPSKRSYGIKAPGYTSNEEFRYAAAAILSGPNTGKLSARGFLPNGLGYNGGSGNPSEVNGQYGWHVQIVSQTATTATVRVWNSVIERQLSPAPQEIIVPGVYTLTYAIGLHNAGPNATTQTLTLTLPSGVALLDYTPTAGAVVSGEVVVWANRPLTVCEWITFTLRGRLTLQPTDPAVDLTASAELRDVVMGNSAREEWTMHADPQGERSALVAIYNSTNGPSWNNKAGWLGTGSPCTWYGVGCEGGRVVTLSLASNNLNGSLPRTLGRLVNLRRLYMPWNQLTWAIPPELGNLPNLQLLDIGGNQLTDPLPATLGQLGNLQEIYLGGNRLTGAIPSQLGNLTNLRRLYMPWNQLSGSIPPQLGNLSNLQLLDLGVNQLAGSLPASLGQLGSLQELFLAGNRLTGAIPSQLGNLANLRKMHMPWNQLSGAVPPELGNLANLQLFDLGANQLTGSLPASLGQLGSLRELWAVTTCRGRSPPSWATWLTCTH